jgi:hypothetical protein
VRRDDSKLIRKSTEFYPLKSCKAKQSRESTGGVWNDMNRGGKPGNYLRNLHFEVPLVTRRDAVDQRRQLPLKKVTQTLRCGMTILVALETAGGGVGEMNGPRTRIN